MIDTESTVTAFLNTNSALTTLASIVASIDPPPTFNPTGAKGVVVLKRRGGSPDYSSKVFDESFQFECIADTESKARAIYRALFTAIDNVKSGNILGTMCEVLGEILPYPETEWPTVLTFFTITFRDGG